MGFKERTPTKVTFDKKGMELEGTIVAVGRAETLQVNTYTLSDADDNLFSFLGTTVLDKVLSKAMDRLVRIVYLGEDKTSSGYRVKQFKVFVWEDESEESEEAEPDKPV